MSVTDQLLLNNDAYARGPRGPVAAASPPALAVVACMDARLDVHRLLGLAQGQAHVIRNAGGVVTEDVIRSLTISQHLLGTREIVLIHHTDCGMLTFTDDAFRAHLQADTGMKPPWAPEAFDDLDGDVREGIERVRASRFIPFTDAVRGFVLDVATGRLSEVHAAAARADGWPRPWPGGGHAAAAVPVGEVLVH